MVRTLTSVHQSPLAPRTWFSAGSAPMFHSNPVGRELQEERSEVAREGGKTATREEEPAGWEGPELSTPGAGPRTPRPARPRPAPAEAVARSPAAAHACAGAGSAAFPGRLCAAAGPVHPAPEPASRSPARPGSMRRVSARRPEARGGRRPVCRRA